MDLRLGEAKVACCSWANPSTTMARMSSGISMKRSFDIHHIAPM